MKVQAIPIYWTVTFPTCAFVYRNVPLNAAGASKAGIEKHTHRKRLDWCQYHAEKLSSLISWFIMSL